MEGRHWRWQKQQQQHQQSYFQNPNCTFQNPNPNPNVYYHSHAFASPNLPHQQWQHRPSFRAGYQAQAQAQNPSFFPPNPSYAPSAPAPPPPPPQARKKTVEEVDKAATKACAELQAAGENVSAWKVSQAALMALEIESWSSLGFQMQQVPSLNNLIAVEGKINAFIHCFVVVQRITSLYDLEVEICKNEGVGKFEELGLGPLVKHPLVLHYFSLPSDVTEIIKITTAEIVLLLHTFLRFNHAKKIEVEEFLDFVANRRKVANKLKLGIHIRNFGTLVSVIKKANKLEDVVLGKHKEVVQPEKKKRNKRPLFSSLKKELDERFDSISQRVESFSSVEKRFRGKHIKFMSSSSEDEPSDDSSYEDGSDDVEDRISPQAANTADRASGCPYPSATEEMTRLGLKSDTKVHPSSASGSQKHPKTSGAVKRKRNPEESGTNSLPIPSKLRKINNEGLDILSAKDANRTKKDSSMVKDDLTSTKRDEFFLTNDSLRLFVAIWKERCQGVCVGKVLKRMLRFYKIRDRKTMNHMYLSYPFIGILNVAVSSIKLGIWDSIYDTVQGISQNDLSKPLISDACEYENINVEPSTKDAPVFTGHMADYAIAVSVEDIITKVAAYLKHDHEGFKNDKSLLKSRFSILRNLFNCENWLAEQFRVKEFRALGYGDFLLFMEKHASLLPQELCGFLIGDSSEKSPLEVHMMHQQLVMLLSQASNNIWENKRITEQDIFSLLTRQFPFITFKVVANGSLKDFLSAAVKDKSFITPKSVIFFSTLCTTTNKSESSSSNKKGLLESFSVRYDKDQDIQTHGFFTPKDAIEVLLKAPMLSDLNLWSHWDLRFAPTLGPLVPWLLKEVKTDELLCLVTRDGKVVRIDPSATADSFLEAAVQGSSFQTAVQLLSLFSVVGGQDHVSVSLLKCHAHHAFKVISKNTFEDAELNGCESSLFNRKVLCGDRMTGERTTSKFSCELNDSRKMNVSASSVSRFILDCLLYLPSEIRAFAADIFLSGMQAIVKDGASAILCECSQTDQRLMLHEVGLSLGVVEWINDYHAFCSKDANDLVISEASCKPKHKHKQGVLEKFSCTEGSADVSVSEDKQIRKCTQVSAVMSNSEVSGDKVSSGGSLSGPRGQKDAALVIESIRRDEFGLDPSLSNVESGMLKKQHARLGRALHCLSQELYSQDSHFILELVQNADDNNYPDYVEPTLTFILQDSGIIVLNNEHGFTAQNIRALCDIGSSTKKGSNAGYIGKKGIGFKSVFRITDAPEIHSNGFHVKFDISEGQIGFVLPTVIPPCDLNLFSRLASSGFDQLGFNNWNTCIVLPFRSRQSEGTAMRSIISMFSDLHPSLLLFLHRLQCIKFRNMLEDSVMVMRKEIVGDGIINVSYGKEKMTWLVVSQKLRSNFIRSDVPMTEISMAFTLQESADGGYSPLLSQQPVFSFLPLRTYGLKFILQGNFDLPSSREEVDGSSSWNQWLLSEFPGLFVEAERSFCALPCFKDTPGKAVAAFMSFVPLLGEVHGFFSSLPRMIISKLRMSKCLLLEGGNREWVPPCKVLRGWSEQAQSILPHGLLHEHLGLGFLDKDVVLSDALAKALGVEEYGPKVIVQLMASLCVKESALKSMGFGWLSSCLAELCSMLEHFPGRTVLDSEMELEIMNNLKRIPFIPLSNGTFSSVNEGTIWIQSDASSSVSDGEHKIESFPSLYAKLRIVSPVLLSVSSIDGSCNDLTISDKLAAVLYKIGVQRLSAHEIIRVHILPALSDVTADKDKNLMIEYVCFVISHLNSSCHDCHVEREYIMSELQNKAYILTNNGFKRPAEVSVHFSMEFGNPVNTTKLIDSLDMGWHEVDSSYLKHPITKSLPSGLSKLRDLFQGIGVTDFVKVIEVEKTVADISHAQFKNFIPDGDSFSLGSIVRDWESPELVKLLSLLSRDGNKKSCEYLLEVLDRLWDSCFSDKTTAYCTSDSVVGSKPFKSSFISSISDVQWVVSTMDNKLHYPRDLFYDCDVVRSVLGASAPYAVPKVKNEKLVTDIGFKTKVTIEDILAMLKLWNCENPFMASISQMSKLYTFIWKEVATSTKLAEEFHSGSFIFVPYTSGSRHEDVVSGMFLSPREVYWSDSTGAMDQVSKMHPQHSLKDVALGPLNKTLCNIYPGLHNFFVNACGVHENPSLSAYLQILLQLSSVALPSQAAKAVFQILLKWTDGLKSGSDDFVFIKESLKKVEFTVLPTKQDKWVSLHPSFGITCWCDDKKLKRHFKHMDGIDFFYFGKLNKDEKEMFRTKVSVLMRTLGIPALSEVVSREALYYGVSDSSFKASLVNWALPYAQRYLHASHPDKYSQLKQSGFDSLKCLQVVVVEQLFYRNVIKSCGSKSEKRVECTCVLEDNVLYTTQESDAHALFLELSRLFFQGNPELQMANFLHMITTMAESGSSEDQTEFFILNSQKIPKLPDRESVWSLPPVSSPEETVGSKTVKNRSSSKSKQKASSTSNWPPVDWKTAPGFSYARAHGFRTQSLVAQPSHDSHQKTEDDYENVDEICDATQISIGGDWTIEDDSGAASTTLALPNTSVLENQWGTANDEAEPEMSREFNPNGLHSTANMFRSGGRSQHYKSDQIRIGAPNQQGILTGRVGEHLAFKYFTEKAGTSTVKWVNKDKETGLPYDLVIEDKNDGKEYIEVKATISPRKNWLMITMKEWQFANEKGDAFSIAHVVLLKNNFARVTVFKNPVKLLEQRKLRLVVVMPTDQEYSVVS